MRRSLATILIASCVLLTNLSPASSAVKPGDACKKSGLTSTSNGFKYTCVKSGKKLVWSKGVKLPAPKPIVSPSATATQAAVTPLSLDNLEYKQVYLASRAEVSKYVANGFTNDGITDCP